MLIILASADQLSLHPEPSALHWQADHLPCSTTFNTRVPFCLPFFLKADVFHPDETMPVLLGLPNDNFSLGKPYKHERPRPRRDGQLSLWRFVPELSHLVTQ